jgi:hypothetical protein
MKIQAYCLMLLIVNIFKIFQRLIKTLSANSLISERIILSIVTKKSEFKTHYHKWGIDKIKVFTKEASQLLNLQE